MKKSATAEKDALFYQHMQEMLRYHQFMLRDEERNKIFYEALERLVTSDTRVLDIGSGSGVWAIAAARLGAKSVTAIESNPIMIPLIMAHAAENGVADRIKIVNGLSLDVNLKHKYDLIVSETIGNQAFDENIVPTMVDARQRFLAKGGVLFRCAAAHRRAGCPDIHCMSQVPAHLTNFNKRVNCSDRWPPLTFVSAYFDGRREISGHLFVRPRIRTGQTFPTARFPIRNFETSVLSTHRS